MTDDRKIVSVSKRGRRPLGERPMTAAERKQRSRERMAQKDEGEFMVRLHKGTLNLVDQIAAAESVSRSEIVERLLDIGVGKFMLAVAQAEQMLAAGATGAEIQAELRGHLGSTPPAGLLKKYKEVCGLEKVG